MFHDDDPALAAPCGAFVTIRRDEELRGCIGFIEASGALLETVREAAIKAATEDYRFGPLDESELGLITLEISVLSPPKPLRSVSDLRIGTHGLIIEAGHHRGLLLPQVAIEHRWDRETFLSNTCRKAGLPPDAWKLASTSILVFSAEVFHEEGQLHASQ